MKILIIPDVHQRIDRVQTILDNESADLIVSQGDWFDNFGDTPMDARRTAEFILELYAKYKNRFVWCLGNHDVGYVFPQVSYKHSCSGMTNAKFKVIQEVFENSLDTSLLSFCYITKVNDKPLVISHAGLSEYLFTDPDTNTVSEDYINRMCEEAFYNCRTGVNHKILVAGRSRGGMSRYAGITWQDWYMDFKPIKGWSQIVGHTPSRDKKPKYNWRPKVKRPPDKTIDEGVIYNIQSQETVNLNLDTHLNHFATLENNILTVYDYTKKYENKKC